MTDTIVSSGATSTGVTVNSGDTLTVLSGGTAVDAVVNSGGVEFVSGTDSGATVNLSGVQNVFAGGVANNVTVNSGGVEYVDGTTNSTLLLHGEEIVLSGGTSFLTTVSGAQEGNFISLEVVSAGGQSFVTTLVAGGLEWVLGIAHETIVSASGQQYVFHGGVASGTTIMGSGLESVESGGIASGSVVSFGGQQTVSSGGVASDSIVHGVQRVSSGGVASGTVVSGGALDLFGTGFGTVVSSGGEETILSGGLASGSVVSSGGLQDVFIGGVASSSVIRGGELDLAGAGFGTVVSSGGRVDLSGIGVGTVVSSGGMETILSGGLASGTTVSDGGQEVVSASGVANGTIITGTGLQTVHSGGTARSATVESGGLQHVFSGGVASDTTVDLGGSVTVSDGGHLSGTIADNGIIVYTLSGTETFAGTLSGFGQVVEQGSGTLVLSNGPGFSGTIVISGGTVELGIPSAAGTAQIDFATGGSEELKIDGPTMPTNTISGLGVGDHIDLAGIVFSSGTTATVSGGQLTVANGGSTLAVLNVDGLADGTPVSVSNNGSGGTELIVCFCRGTRIQTERGEIPVEALAVGDRVVTLSGELKPIRWIGFGRDLVTVKNPLARPIIVRRGALADEVPRRDLYLTHGHALHFDGVLIPVEHLVNHRSILWDDEARVVEYYHIELEDHDVVFAEGAPAESYYDDTNRALFHNTRPGSTPGAARPTFAPVLHSGEIVGRVWAALSARVGERGIADTTDDPDLHLVIDGVRLDPASVADCLYTFTLAAPPSSPLLLASRSAVPSLLGVSRHEHRRLGVAIRQIVLAAPGVTTAFDHDAALFAEGGCHAAEPGFCWTDGDLALPAHLFTHLAGPFRLFVHTARLGMRYPLTLPAAKAA
ncbi:MAG TPA: Hint domain-containing protein [Stellaceae bacterium]|nr:Hint domain-containing protein [Stellaceae bacterium]